MQLVGHLSPCLCIYSKLWQQLPAFKELTEVCVYFYQITLHVQGFSLLLGIRNMNTTNNGTHGDDHSSYIYSTQVVSIVLSLVLGLMAAVFNGLLLFTLYRDPLKCFRRRASIIFIIGLAVSDLLAGLFIQPIFVVTLVLAITSGKQDDLLHKIAFLGSHVTAKISILTLVVLAVDRLLAIALPWKYSRLVTRKRALFMNIIIWITITAFEASHSFPSMERVLHKIDLHLQTTVPIIGLLVIFVATYLSFRKHSRSKVFVQTLQTRSTRRQARNFRFERKIMITILLILLVVLVSLLPYLIVQQMGNNCDHEHGHDDSDHDDNGDDDVDCEESKAAQVVQIISISLLCVSCAMNPVLYGWRVPHFRQSLKMVTICQHENTRKDLSIPSMLQLTDGKSAAQDESGTRAALA